jgi:hypothetical protein
MVDKDEKELKKYVRHLSLDELLRLKSFLENNNDATLNYFTML